MNNIQSSKHLSIEGYEFFLVYHKVKILHQPITEEFRQSFKHNGKSSLLKKQNLELLKL